MAVILFLPQYAKSWSYMAVYGKWQPIKLTITLLNIVLNLQHIITNLLVMLYYVYQIKLHWVLHNGYIW